MNSNYIITSNGSFIREDELYHWGVKGMKWGVRRYQNPDGSLTAAGKKRRRSNEVSGMSTDELRKKVNRMNNEQRYIDLSKSSSSAISKTAEGVERASKTAGDVNKIYKSTKGDNNPYGKVAGQSIDAVSRASRLTKKIDEKSRTAKAAKEARKKLDTMSDSELAKEVERLDLERQYSRLRSSDINRGKVRVSEVLDIAGDVIGITASAVSIAVAIKKLTSK